jgi:hypothetical protein
VCDCGGLGHQPCEAVGVLGSKQIATRGPACHRVVWAWLRGCSGVKRELVRDSDRARACGWPVTSTVTERSHQTYESCDAPDPPILPHVVSLFLCAVSLTGRKAARRVTLFGQLLGTGTGAPIRVVPNGAGKLKKSSLFRRIISRLGKLDPRRRQIQAAVIGAPPPRRLSMVSASYASAVCGPVC